MKEFGTMFVFWQNTGFSERVRTTPGIDNTNCIDLWFSTDEGSIASSLIKSVSHQWTSLVERLQIIWYTASWRKVFFGEPLPL